MHQFLAIFFFALIFCPPHLLRAHTPAVCSPDTKHLIAQPTLNLYEECNTDSPYVSQGIYGHLAIIIERLNDGWALLETEDRYRGYGKVEALVRDDPCMRTSRSLASVAAIAALVYPKADTASQPLMRLPFGAYVELTAPLNSSCERWRQLRLLNGREGWMQQRDLEEPKIRSQEEVVGLAHRFLERPYVWGGTSSDGFDCSGYVQTLCRQRGILLARDSGPQSESDELSFISQPERPGDLVFFGEGRVTHVGFYLGEERFIHSGVRDATVGVGTSSLTETRYNYLCARRLNEAAFHSQILPISEATRMESSWRENNPVPLSDLRLVILNYWGFDRVIHEGKLIVHKNLADEVVEIFSELFSIGYPIEKMHLIDAYDGDDSRSCADNNTSSFCSRPITGKKDEWSFHSYGTAIDVNPLLNPYQRGTFVVPDNGRPFLDRTLPCLGLLGPDDACYKAFIRRGWLWGGDWQETCGYVDYQHFYKEPADVL